MRLSFRGIHIHNQCAEVIHKFQNLQSFQLLLEESHKRPSHFFVCGKILLFRFSNIDLNNTEILSSFRTINFVLHSVSQSTLPLYKVKPQLTIKRPTYRFGTSGVLNFRGAIISFTVAMSKITISNYTQLDNINNDSLGR
jgi:hypothetical protein